MEKRRFWKESSAWSSVVARGNGVEGEVWKRPERSARRKYDSASVVVDVGRVCPLE